MISTDLGIMTGDAERKRDIKARARQNTVQHQVCSISDGPDVWTGLMGLTGGSSEPRVSDQDRLTPGAIKDGA